MSEDNNIYSDEVDVFIKTVESQIFRISQLSDFEVIMNTSLSFSFIKKTGEATLKATKKYYEVVDKTCIFLRKFKEVKSIRLFLNYTFSITIDCQYGGYYINVPNTEALIANQEELKKVHDLVDYAINSDFVKTAWISLDEGFNWTDCGKIFNGHFYTGIRNGKLSGLIVDRQSIPHSYKFWLWKNDPKDCRIPPGCNMNIGGTALLLDKKNNKVCLVCPNDRAQFFNFPGGNLDFYKDNWLIELTAFRETCEELGIENDILKKHITSQSMVALMSFPGNSFAGAINVTICFFVDGLSDFKIKLEESEIESGLWIDIDEVLTCNGNIRNKTISNSIILSIKAALDGKGFVNVDSGVDFMKLWIPQ